jgi:hypothetical protein|tara:strand:- start:8500 stop:9345 length:846 start_codon:yes stop_codon:yes gene_type:complete
MAFYQIGQPFLHIFFKLNTALKKAINISMSINNDFRGKLQAKPGAKEEIYGSKDASSNLLAPIAETNGMIMPYTPAIQVQHASVEYTQYNIPQTNFDYMAYARRASPRLSVTMPYTANNVYEARYMLAVIHFLRTVTMSYYGIQNDKRRGVPPPILLFSAYGPYMFDKVPVLIQNVSFGLEQDVDYVPAGMPADYQVAESDRSPGHPAMQTMANERKATADNFGSINQAIQQSYVPTVANIFMDIVYAPVPSVQRDQFDLDSFRKGTHLLKGNKNGNRGFI